MEPDFNSIGDVVQEQDGQQGSFSAENPSIGDVPTQAPEVPVEDFLRDDPLDSPDVAELKNNLKAGFHRQLNKLQAREAALNQDPSKQEELSTKARAFDNLLKNPQAIEALKVLQQNQQQAPTVVPFNSSQIVTKLPKAISEKFEAEHLDPLVSLTWQVIENGLLPMLRPYQMMLEQQVTQQYNTERDSLAQQYTATPQIMQQAERLASQKGLTLKQAMLLVTNGASVQPQTQQNGQVLPRSVPNRQTTQVKPNGYTDDDIAQELFNMDQGGNKRYSLNFMRRGN